MSLPDWDYRQPDFANLFNPPFLAMVLHACCAGYEEKLPGGMPFSLAFLVAPLSVTPGVQARLPARTNARLSKWLNDHPHLKSDGVAAASALVPYIREGIAAGLQGGILRLNGGRLASGAIRASAAAGKEALASNAHHFRSAHFIGKWMASSGPEADIFMQFGVRP